MYIFDRNKFNEITTPEECYWLGFIEADGYIPLNKCKNPSGVKIKLKGTDEEHIKKFINFMNAEEPDKFLKYEYHNITGNKLVYCQFNSGQVAKNLEKYGICNKKSEREVYIPNLPFQRDYIRGLIDGDGFITSTRYGIGLVGSYNICNGVQQYILSVLNIEPKKIHSHGTIFKIEYHSKEEVIKICSHLYQENDISLDRKRELVEKIC